MEDNPSVRSRRRKFTLGSIMMAIAGLAGIFTVARPLAKPPTVRASEAVLRRYGESGLNLNHYRVESIRKTPSGYWHVEFVRVSGAGVLKQSAVVSDGLITKYRFNPWYSLPE